MPSDKHKRKPERGSSTRRKSHPAKSRTPESIDLDALRTRIDTLDAKIIQILNERAEVVSKVGELKRAKGIPIYAPHRDVEVIDRVLKMNTGPLPARTLEAIYRELMSGSFALEKPLRIGYLGPPGSFSHAAAVTHFGSSVEHADLHQIDAVFAEVRRGHADYGLVPIENSIGGGITETLDALRAHAGQVFVYAEVQVEVHHALLGNCPPDQIRRIHSKPEVFSQCRTWLATQYPKADLIAAASSSQGAKTAAEEFATAERIGATCVSAAIGSELAAQIYGLKTLFRSIEDNPSNVTRFYVISRQRAARSGDDKTSIMFTTSDTPGALVEVLSVFDRAGINLTHIDKRPSGRTNWDYTFFVDAQGYCEDEVMAGAIAEAGKHCRDLRVLGSYPRSKRTR